MMLFKKQASVEMPMNVYKVLIVRAAPYRLLFQQHCDFLFRLYHDLIYNEPFT